jgi:hypothetical protein
MLNIDLFPTPGAIHPAEREYQEPQASDFATTAYTSHIIESHRVEEVREGYE